MTKITSTVKNASPTELIIKYAVFCLLIHVLVKFVLDFLKIPNYKVGELIVFLVSFGLSFKNELRVKQIMVMGFLTGVLASVWGGVGYYGKSSIVYMIFLIFALGIITSLIALTGAASAKLALRFGRK